MGAILELPAAIGAAVTGVIGYFHGKSVGESTQPADPLATLATVLLWGTVAFVGYKVLLKGK